MSKNLSLSKGRTTLVDDEWFDELNKNRWYVDNGGAGYVVRAAYTAGRQTKIALHRVVAGAKDGQQVDHINHDKYDNRSANLRCVTHTENQRNRSPRKDSSSGHVGVYFISRMNAWRAQIYVSKTVHLGYFNTLEEAVAARKAANVKYGYHVNHGIPAPNNTGVICA